MHIVVQLLWTFSDDDNKQTFKTVLSASQFNISYKMLIKYDTFAYVVARRLGARAR